MAIKANYIQGETIAAEALAATATAVTFRWWPVRSSLARTAAQQLLSSLKSSLSVGEISMSDKTAEEIAALDGLLCGRTAAAGGSVAMTADAATAGRFTANVATDAMFGEYQYAAIAADAAGVNTLVSSGTFTVDGDPEAAGAAGGGMTRIYTRF